MPSRKLKKKNLSALVILHLLLFFLSPSLLFAQVELQYQSRASENVQYSEGIKPKPVSGMTLN